MMNRNFAWRGDGRLEMVCCHGVGHTVSALVSGEAGLETRDAYYIHGCDGCCHNDELLGRLLRPIKELAAIREELVAFQEELAASRSTTSDQDSYNYLPGHEMGM